MQESDTYWMIIEEGQEKQSKKDILLFGEKRLGSATEYVKAYLQTVSDLERLDRMIECAVTASSWQEILDTP